MHHKYCVIDSGFSNGILIIGSMNWSNSVSIYNNNNNKNYKSK